MCLAFQLLGLHAFSDPLAALRGVMGMEEQGESREESRWLHPMLKILQTLLMQQLK